MNPQGKVRKEIHYFFISRDAKAYGRATKVDKTKAVNPRLKFKTRPIIKDSLMSPPPKASFLNKSLPISNIKSITKNKAIPEMMLITVVLTPKILILK